MTRNLLVTTVMVAALASGTLARDGEPGARAATAARVALLAADAEALKGAEPLLAADAGRAPDYLRAFALAPAAAKPFAALLRAVVYGDSLEPEVKLAMGNAVARRLGGEYVAAHTARALSASARGRALLAALEAGRVRGLSDADALALEYAEALTDDVNGITDERFRRTRVHFNDSQIVELTTTVCFFNYFSRLVQGLGLSPEPWAIERAADAGERLAASRREGGPVPRVGLITDAEFAGFGVVAEAAKAQPSGGLGLGIANSQRAMMRAPDARARGAPTGRRSASTTRRGES